MKDSESHVRYWRSLDELAQHPELSRQQQNEFPKDASEFPAAAPADANGDNVSRRGFLKVMAAPLALAGLSGCGLVRKPVRNIYPYAQQPEGMVTGKADYYATTHTFGGEAVGLLVKSHEGRPTKVEGNPKHPVSGGRTSSFQQASVLELYNPTRLQNILQAGQTMPATALDGWFAGLSLADTGGAGTAVVFSEQNSPTFYRLLSALKERYPKLSVYRYNAVTKDAAISGISTVTTTATRALPFVDYAAADVIVSLDADIMGLGGNGVSDVSGFSARRTPAAGTMNRLYCYESTFTLTGAVADHRFRLKRRHIEMIVYQLFYRFYERGIARINRAFADRLRGVFKQVQGNFLKSPGYRAVNAIVNDLLAKPGRAVIVAGDGQPPLVHALVAYMNEFIKAPLQYRVSPFAVAELAEPSVQALTRLRADLTTGKVKNVINLSADLLYTAPQDLAMADVFSAANTLSLAFYHTATTAASNLVVPQTHYLEDWSDAYTSNGRLSLVQPLIAPLIADAYSPTRLLARLVGENEDEAALVRATHRFDARSWSRTLHDGVAAESYTRDTVRNLVVDAGKLEAAVTSEKFPLYNAAADELELTFDLDYSVYDGSFYHNAWMQELPDPITKLTWENVAVFSYHTAKRFGVKSQELVKLKVGNVEVEAPVWVLPGQADDSIALKLGYGQTLPEGMDIAGGGYNAYSLRSAANLSTITGVTVTPTGQSCRLASVQGHWAIDDQLFTGGPSGNSQNGRPLYRTATLSEYQRQPAFAKAAVVLPVLPAHHERSQGLSAAARKKQAAQRTANMSIYDEVPLTGEYQWGMDIDLTSCTGCNACVVACQAENNIPVVGKEMVLKGREMHWLRIDRYFEGDPVDAKLVRQPVLCMHCEQAPCEQVCPVTATVHSDEGLNDMVYNRCVGTRFCSNNCPYKVRRFNFLDYHGRAPHSQKRVSSHIFDLFREPNENLQLQFNPDVTVRMRGVMEKCTYCVQRINAARVTAGNEGRKIADGEIVTACEQACPASSIVFGNIADENSRVSKRKRVARNYVILEELNIKPRTSYSAAITNPNPVVLAMS